MSTNRRDPVVIFDAREYPEQEAKLLDFIFNLSGKNPDVAIGLLQTVSHHIEMRLGIKVEVQDVDLEKVGKA